MAKPFIIGNWKMNPESLASAKKIFQDLVKKATLKKISNLIICPPAPFICELKKIGGSRVVLGAQDVFYEPKGPFTGEVAAEMLASVGTKFVIIGHSERRMLGETDIDVSRKAKISLKYGLRPIICIGEKERNDEGGHFPFLASQLKESLSNIGKKDLNNILIAYEPVWAIGDDSKGAMEPREIQETVLFLRRIISEMYGKKEAMSVNFIYGGSVDEKNAKQILREGGISGFLIGRVSLLPERLMDLAMSVS